MKHEIVRFIFAPWELYRTALGIERDNLKVWFTVGWMATVFSILSLLIAATFV